MACEVGLLEPVVAAAAAALFWLPVSRRRVSDTLTSHLFLTPARVPETKSNTHLSPEWMRGNSSDGLGGSAAPSASTMQSGCL